eukprot:gene4103-5132_t
MSWTLKEKANYTHMVWRNGKGKSTQIHIEPENLTLSDPFKWRISTATITSAGAFSSFEGYKRTIVLISGNQLTLFHKQKPQEPVSLEYFKPYSFSGSWDTDSIFQSKPSPALLSVPQMPPPELAGTKDYLSTTAAGNNSGSYSSSPNSPILPHILMNTAPPTRTLEESQDFGVISKDGEYDHEVEVIPFTSNDDRTDYQIVLDPTSFPNRSSLVLYSYNSKFTIKKKGIEGTYQKCRILSQHSLVIKDMVTSPSSSQQQQQLHLQPPSIIVKCNEKNENSHLIVIKITPTTSLTKPKE